MAAITDLTTLADSDVADGDLFVVHDADAATDKKISASDLHLLRMTTGNALRQELEGYTVADNGTMTIPSTSGRGLLFAYSEYDGTSVLGVLDGSTITFLYNGSSAQWSATANTANRLNIYPSGGNIIIQNKRGVAIAIRAWLLL